jgi:lia operon protein LiaG
MKTMFYVLAFILLNSLSAYCGGLSEKDLVNAQEIGLEHITDIEILYRWEKIIIRQNNTDEFILKEYMNKNNPRYYANISNRGNKLSIERGHRPIGIFINTFDVQVEVFIPKSYMNSITIKTKSGGIEAADEFICRRINIETSSGNIRINSITAETISLKTSSGSINADNAKGSIFSETSSGRIKFDQIIGSLTANASSGNMDVGMINGNILAETTSGSIHCSTGENTENISLTSSSGGITLAIPRNISSNFSSRTSSGRLSTPFSEKLFIPVSDRNSVQGIIGGDNPTKNINLKTNSGSIRVNWVN